MDDDTKNAIYLIFAVVFAICFVISTIVLMSVWGSTTIEREKAEMCAKCPECSCTQNCDKQEEN